MNKVTALSTLFGFMVMVVGSVITFDARYGHADEVKANKEAIQSVTGFTAAMVDELRLELTQDKIRAIKLIPESQRDSIHESELLRLQDAADRIKMRLSKEEK